MRNLASLQREKERTTRTYTREKEKCERNDKEIEEEIKEGNKNTKIF